MRDEAAQAIEHEEDRQDDGAESASAAAEALGQAIEHEEAHLDDGTESASAAAKAFCEGRGGVVSMSGVEPGSSRWDRRRPWGRLLATAHATANAPSPWHRPSCLWDRRRRS